MNKNLLIIYITIYLGGTNITDECVKELRANGVTVRGK